MIYQRAKYYNKRNKILELLQRLVRLTNKYASSPMRIWLGPRLAIFVKDPDQLQVILCLTIHVHNSNVRFYLDYSTVVEDETEVVHLQFSGTIHGSRIIYIRRYIHNAQLIYQHKINLHQFNCSYL